MYGSSLEYQWKVWYQTELHLTLIWILLFFDGIVEHFTFQSESHLCEIDFAAVSKRWLLQTYPKIKFYLKPPACVKTILEPSLLLINTGKPPNIVSMTQYDNPNLQFFFSSVFQSYENSIRFLILLLFVCSCLKTSHFIL